MNTLKFTFRLFWTIHSISVWFDFPVFYKCLTKVMYYFVTLQQIVTFNEVFSEVSSYTGLYK